jgi:hypothetical protein
VNVAICIGCGCDDDHACDDGLGGGCSWLVVDRGRGLGVCSNCPTARGRWDRGDRKLSDKARRQVSARIQSDGAEQRKLAKAGINSKLLSKAQRLALEHLWHGPFVRGTKRWAASHGGEHGLVTVSRLKLLGLAIQYTRSDEQRCKLTAKGRATVRRMLHP